MFIQPIGIGGAFDQFGTCFIVNESVLIDCCPSAIKRTFADGRAAKINNVFLTHAHQDHVGGIEFLVYYLKYVAKKGIPKIHCPATYFNLAMELACFSSAQPHNMCDHFEFLDDYENRNRAIRVETKTSSLLVKPFNVDHSNMPAFGFMVYEVASDKLVVFSGDTNRAIKLPSGTKFDLMFHDVGWEGLEDRADRVHPFEREVWQEFGMSNVITVHSEFSTHRAIYPRAVVDRVYEV